MFSLFEIVQSTFFAKIVIAFMENKENTLSIDNLHSRTAWFTCQVCFHFNFPCLFLQNRLITRTRKTRAFGHAYWTCFLQNWKLQTMRLLHMFPAIIDHFRSNTGNVMNLLISAIWQDLNLRKDNCSLAELVFGYKEIKSKPSIPFS